MRSIVCCICSVCQFHSTPSVTTPCCFFCCCPNSSIPSRPYEKPTCSMQPACRLSLIATSLARLPSRTNVVERTVSAPSPLSPEPTTPPFPSALYPPHAQGVAAIVASWALSPVFSGVIAVFLFLVVRTFVLRSEHSLKRSLVAFPLLVTATIAVNGEGRKAAASAFFREGGGVFSVFILLGCCFSRAGDRNDGGQRRQKKPRVLEAFLRGG